METNNQPRDCCQDVVIGDDGMVSVGKPQMNKPMDTMGQTYDEYRAEKQAARFGMFNPVRKRTK